MINTFPEPERCPICRRIKNAISKDDPRFIHEFKHSVLLLGEHDYHHGYATLLLKSHVQEMHEADRSIWAEHFQELMLATTAMAKVLSPAKMNIASLGNKDAHVHWHLIPRHHSDPDRYTQPWLQADRFASHQLTDEDARNLGGEIRTHIRSATNGC